MGSHPQDAVAVIRRFNESYFPKMAPVRRALMGRGFNATELRILRALGRAPVGLSIAWFAGWLGIDWGQASRTVWDLCERGFIECRSSDRDRRIKEVTLTQAGLQLHANLERVANEAVNDLIWLLTNDQRCELVDAMEAIERLLGLPTWTTAPARSTVRSTPAPG